MKGLLLFTNKQNTEGKVWGEGFAEGRLSFGRQVLQREGFGQSGLGRRKGDFRKNI